MLRRQSPVDSFRYGKGEYIKPDPPLSEPNVRFYNRLAFTISGES